MELFKKCVPAVLIAALGMASHAGADIVTGLAQHLTMDDASGTTVTDSSVNGDNGTLTINSSGVGSGFNPTGGYIGGAAKLWEQGGATDYVTINPVPADANWANAGGRTISMWFNLEQASSFTRWIFNIKHADNKIYAYTESDSDLVLRVQENGGDDYQVIGPTVSTNAWHQIIMTFGGGNTPEFYFDGQLISGSTSLTPDPTFFSGNQLIGSDGGTLFGMRGLVDDFRVYTRALEGTVDGSGNLTGGDLYELYTYDGTPIPEPASAGLIVLGVMCLLQKRKVM